MKKLLYLLVLALIFVGCEKEPDTKKPFQIQATDMISIKPAILAQHAPMRVKSDTILQEPVHLSALEIVKQTSEMSLRLSWGVYGGRGFIPEQRDTVSNPPKLLMWATDVIRLDGEIETDFIEATDVVFVHYLDETPNLRDTIAYIPNSVLRAAETAIRAAYEDQDIEECYRLFNDAYTFLPITGEEWRALKLQEQN